VSGFGLAGPWSAAAGRLVGGAIGSVGVGGGVGGGSGDFTLVKGHRYQITLTVPLVSMTQEDVDGFRTAFTAMSAGKAPIVNAALTDEHTMVVVFDYVGETKSASIPATTGTSMSVQDLGPSPAPEGMSTGAKVAIGVGVTALAAGVLYFVTRS
jgi:hypothetical protein